MYRLKSLPWPEIGEFYQDLVSNHGWQVQPMLDLVSFIEQSPYAQGLFACTSHDRLLVTRIRDPSSDECRLEIAFDGKRQAFTFRYVQRADDAAPWSRTCRAQEGISTFARLMTKRLGWFSQSTGQNLSSSPAPDPQVRRD